MLTDATIERILAALPRLTVAVIGDLFLDRYLDLDERLTEPSLETGLDAYQVWRVRPSPGAAGTVINNLAALGVGRICPVAVIGDDGEGYELRRALAQLRVVDGGRVLTRGDRFTPTYTKPMLGRPGESGRELNRLDIKNRTPLPAEAEALVAEAVQAAWKEAGAVIVLDQVSEEDCGVVTARVRRQLAELGRRDPERPALADSRERIGRFEHLWLKPNQRECRQAATGLDDVAAGASMLAGRVGRPVFCTVGEEGMVVADPRGPSPRTTRVPAYPVSVPIDIVGAGDSCSAGLACALAAGAGLEEAAAFGNLVASITIQQIGTTGTASPQQVKARWAEVQP